MNYPLITKLILKDWYFNRIALSICLLAGIGAIMTVALGGETGFYVGSVLFVAVLAGLGITLTITTIILERTEHTLPFVMSLPISVMDYTVSKVLANLLIFLIPWLILAGGSILAFVLIDTLPNGFIPFIVMVVTELLLVYCLILSVALISESEGWTILAIVLTQLFFNFYLYFIAHLPDVQATMEGPVAQWTSSVWWTLSIEAVLLIAILVTTYVLQSRKKDFL